ncbi:hypothetical protein ACFV5C_36840, partial [Streptomyces sp. NPDC059762]
MAVIEAPSLYMGLGALYERELDAHDVGAVMLTHKWQPADLLAPHSDIDVRVLISQAPTDWEEWNQRLAAAHTAAVSREISHRRLLEHPPGFAFTVAEADGRLVSAPELATWSLISGSAPRQQPVEYHGHHGPKVKKQRPVEEGQQPPPAGGPETVGAGSR